MIPNVCIHPDTIYDETSSQVTTPQPNLYMHCCPAAAVTTRIYLDVDVGRAAIVSAWENCADCSQAGTVGQCQAPQKGQVVCLACVVAVGCGSACRVYKHFDLDSELKYTATQHSKNCLGKEKVYYNKQGFKMSVLTSPPVKPE